MSILPWFDQLQLGFIREQMRALRRITPRGRYVYLVKIIGNNHMYSPKIKEELVAALYQLKQQTKTPMTRLVNEAVTEYLIRHPALGGQGRNSDGLRKSNN